jgi:hypothetical protein
MAQTCMRGYKVLVLAILSIVLFVTSAGAVDNEPTSRATAAERRLAPTDGATESEAASDEEPFKRHKLNLAYGYTHIPEGAEEEGGEKSVWVPGLGLDYFYRLNEKWEIGAAVDIEFGKYLIIDKDLSRHNAYILIALAGYEVVPFWAVFGGVGIEIEEHKNLAVFRLGTGYEFMFQNDWLIAPGLLVDYKVDFTSYSFYVAAGKVF